MGKRREKTDWSNEKKKKRRARVYSNKEKGQKISQIKGVTIGGGEVEK